MNSYSYGLVILSYNHPELTAKTLSSVLNLGYPENQVVLVHNGSEPVHLKTLHEKFPHLQHLVLTKNQGFSGGANRGLEKAFQQHEQVLFLTNDIEMTLLPTSISRKFDITAPLIWKRNSQQVDSVLGGLCAKTGTLQHFKSQQDQSLSGWHWVYVPGTAFTITKSCFVALGGFDESFHTYWEDVDLSVRAHKQGFSLGHEPEIQLRHKIGKTCHKDRFYTLYLFQRNRRRLMKKHSWDNWYFRASYGLDMAKIFFRISLNPKPKAPLQLWWKALND